MIDILYIKREKKLNGDKELMYSLRSVDKYIKDYKRIFITGTCPEYIDKDKVIFLPERDIGFPMSNHWWKVYKTIQKGKISRNKFALMYDDIFFVKPTKLENYPFYQRGLLGESNTGSNSYRLWLENTRKYLLENNKPIFDYELHVPCVYKTKEFLELPISENDFNFKDKAVRSTYANMFLKNQPYRKDIKLRGNERVDEVIGDYDCFSVGDDTFKNALEYLEKEFPNKSRWEK